MVNLLNKKKIALKHIFYFNKILFMSKTFKQLKKIVIAVIGFTILLVGIILVVTPGPASLVIPAGLAVLGTEFVWAEKLLKKVKTRLTKEYWKSLVVSKEVPPAEIHTEKIKSDWE